MVASFCALNHCLFGHAHTFIIMQMHIDENGVKIDTKISDYYWVGSLLGSRKLHNVAAAADAAVISVEDPDSAWCNLLSALKKAVHNNFMPAFFMLGAAAMAMHYEAVLGKYGMCPTPVAIGGEKTWESPQQ